MTYRRRLADLLVRAALRLDPDRPTLTSKSDGSWLVSIRGIGLAAVTPGNINDQRRPYYGR